MNMIKPIIYRYQPTSILSSNELLNELVEYAQISPEIMKTPYFDDSFWNMGLSTITGNVRDENQDYAFSFNLGSNQIMILADGMGGQPYGKRASYSVVKASAFSIVKELGKRFTFSRPDLQEIITQAINTASNSLSAKADKIDSYNKGLRTTLIIIIADNHEYAYGYIGDGGIVLVRESTFMHLLNPHKANKYIPNLLSASLGPTIHGEMTVSSIEREKHDFLIAGTDGIFDRLEASPDDFPQGTNNFLILLMIRVSESNGNLNQLTVDIINELADFKDDQGYLCNDNLTLGLLGNFKIPEIIHKKV